MHHPHRLLGGVGFDRLRDGAGRLWRRLTEVHTTDPVRRVLGGGLAALMLIALAYTLAMVPITILGGETPVLIVSLVSLPLQALSWWLNRRGSSAGALLYVLWVVLALVLAMNPHHYVGPTTPIPLVLIFPVIIATFFIRPLAGLWTALLLLLLIGARVALSDVPGEHALRFMLLGTVNLVGITNFLVIAAAIALRALRASFVASDSLQELNDALARAEERYRSIVENAAEGIYQVTPDEVVIAANPALARMLGYRSPAELMQLGGISKHIDVAPERRAEIGRLLVERGGIEQFEAQIFPRGRGPIWALISMRIVRDTQGNIAYYEGTARDITESKRAEARLRESEARYRTLVEHAPEAIVVIDATTGGFVEVNENAVRLFGLPKAALLGMGLAELSPPQQPDGRSSLHCIGEATREAAEGGTPVFEWACRGPGTTITPCEIRLVRLPSNRHVLVRGSIMDISARKELEAQLRQAQKMEAIGRLAGGVAHDFNNLLTVILSYAELAQLSLEHGSPIASDLQQIQKAGKRAAALTHQLLAFSRRQVLQPVLVSANAIVGDVSQLLQRLIGEDIELETRLAAELGMVLVDPNQTQQALLNLAVNARDAMPSGGRLTIETANVELTPEQAAPLGAPGGSYIMVALSDTGHGMDAETQARIFEPFFTSKPVGQGTGLGLAMVHGFVTQSGGFIAVESTPGRGSTFKIYLPRVCAERVDPEGQVPPRPASRGSETVLLVEDDAIVRMLARQILKLEGYRVLDAAQGTEALALLEDQQIQVDLVISDVVMPGGMSGPQLVERVLALRPELRVLYISGYADSTVVDLDGQERRPAFLQKPFTPEGLARKVRDVLDEGPGTGGLGVEEGLAPHPAPGP